MVVKMAISILKFNIIILTSFVLKAQMCTKR